MRFEGPLARSYPAAGLLVIAALVPYLALSSSLTPLAPLITKQVGLSTQSLELTAGMANAAYAFGTITAVQLAQHLHPRRALIIYASLFVLGSLATVLHPTPGFFIAGRIVQGLTTSLMLIAAVPPLVIGWPASKLPATAVILNLGVFGAVAVGPVIGGVQASTGAWQGMFWIVCGVGGLALLMAVLTFRDDPPVNPSAPKDLIANLLAGGGAAAAFFGAAQLTTHAMLSTIVLVPLLVGLGLIALLIVHQYALREPLVPVRDAATTMPVIGIVMAICAAAASVAVITLAQTAAQGTGSPVHIAMLFWPEFGAAAATALLVAAVVRTRWIPVVAFSGLIMLAGGAAVLTGVVGGPHALIIVGSGMVGLGVGSSVAPSLFLAGFSLRVIVIQRVFALIELLRGVAAFMMTPVILHLATTAGSTPTDGIGTAIWVCFGLALAGAFIGLYLFALGRPGLQRPDVETWNEGERPAWHSPPLLDGIRGERALPVAARRSPA